MPVVHHLTRWENPGVKLGVGVQIDGLACIVMFVVTLVCARACTLSTCAATAGSRTTTRR
jgi:hypothetical protein